MLVILRLVAAPILRAMNWQLWTLANSQILENEVPTRLRRPMIRGVGGGSPR